MKKTDNRENILETALQLFSEHGYDSVGIQEIVDRAEITKPTLYHYFGNKKGLLASILDKYYNILLASLESAAVYRGDLVNTLTELVNRYFNFAGNNNGFFYLLLALNFVPPSNPTSEVIFPYQQKFNNLLQGVFIKAGEQHGNLRGHQVILAGSLTAVLNHYALGIVNGSLKNEGDFVYRVVKQYMYGIYVL
jgi:AcrR family transcriptional regulator